MRSGIFAFLVGQFLIPLSQASSDFSPYFSSPLKLSEAIQYALRNSPSFDTAKKTQFIRNLEYKNAVAKLLPSLDLSATHGLQNNFLVNNNFTLISPNSTAPWYSALNLGITANLYDNGASITQVSIAEKNQEVAALVQAKERAQLTLNIAVEFYQFSLAHVLIEVRQKQLSQLTQQFKLLSVQFQQGLKPRLDFLRFKAQVQRAQIEKTATQKRKELSETQLRKLLSQNLLEDSAFSPFFHFAPIPVEDNLKSHFSVAAPTIENFFDFKLARLQKEINELNVNFTRRKYWPQILLGAGVTYSNFNYLNSSVPFANGNQLTYNALLTIQYNIWDWGSRKRDVAIAESNRDIQDNQLNLNLLDVQAKMNSLMINLARVTENYALAQELVENEEQNFSNVEMSYQEGKSTYLDLINSLSNLQDAKVQYYSVHFEALQLLAQRQFYEGSIYEALVH